MVKPPIVMGAGELLWDLFPDARRPGGAPANVAFHAQQLGLDGVVLSRVGQDELGEELLQFLRDHRLSTQWVQRDREHETGRVTVDLSNPDHPRFTIHENVAWDYFALDTAAQQLAAKTAAICFGTLAQRNPVSRAAIQGLLMAAANDCLLVYDVNLRPPWFDRHQIASSLASAQIVKLNDEEVGEIATLLDIPFHDAVPVARRLQATYDVDLVCVTRGAEGCWLVDRDDVAEVPGIRIAAADPVGAGDAFTAALIFATLRGWSLQVRAEFSNQTAAMVAGRQGAMPELQAEFAETILQFEKA